MPLSEIFPNPTVKQVAFEIKFPNLFFIESKIGDLQMKIIDKFPESALLFQRQLVLALSTEKIEDLQQKVPQEQGVKIWQFNNPDLGYELKISSNSLNITSKSHKTYNNQQSDNRFRDIIAHVLKPFFDLTKLPTVNRVGLRYIDECPFKEQTTTSFLAHFNSCLSTTRFSIEDSVEHQYVAFVKRGEYFLRYAETYNANKNPTSLTLDFDGSANNVQSAACLDTTDQLHILIVKEYKATIKDPVYDYMRGGTKDAS
jgi:uncharacterized protein (TIGR04255 family)